MIAFDSLRNLCLLLFFKPIFKFILNQISGSLSELFQKVTLFRLQWNFTFSSHLQFLYVVRVKIFSHATCILTQICFAQMSHTERTNPNLSKYTSTTYFIMFYLQYHSPEYFIVLHSQRRNHLMSTKDKTLLPRSRMRVLRSRYTSLKTAVIRVFSTFSTRLHITEITSHPTQK